MPVCILVEYGYLHIVSYTSAVVPNLGSTDGSRGLQDLKVCITVNGRGSTGCLIFAIGGPRLKKVGNRCTSAINTFT